MGIVAVTPVTFRTVVILLCFFVANPCAAKLQTFTRTYHTFDRTTMFNQPDSELIFLNYARISQNALQITPDTGRIANQSGRIMFRRPFKLWDDDSTVAGSFNTSFLVNMYPQPRNGTPGEGFAFLIAPSTEIPNNSFGGYLGLTNPDNEYENGIVAVELDTFKQPFDNDDNHIGLNIHSVRSFASEPLTPFNITLAPYIDPAFHNVWIRYNDSEKIIRVYIADQPQLNSPTPPMPETPIIEEQLDLRKTVKQESYFGFSASTGTTSLQLNAVLRWNITIEHFDEPKRKFKEPLSPLIMAALISIGILGALLACLGYYLYKKRYVDPSQVNILSHLRTLPGMPKEFHFQELKKATNNFDENRKLGQGGFGVVYRAVLPEDNVEVAVKWFSRESSKGEYDFLAELTIINRLRHKHLVRLLGWCHKNGKLLLVYEYMQNASLDMHLFNTRGDPLSWSLRCKILGVASALHYLHYEYDQKVVHRDIKASNIMLDSNFNARLGDFGLARALENERTSYAEAGGIHGTIGYLAPECLLTGKATQYSDIYAFGALIIEVVSGKRPGTKMNGFHLMVDYVWSLYREGQILDVVDERIAADYDAEEAQRLLLLGLACSHPIASERPKTHVIVQILNGSMPVPTVPPLKPHFVYPALMPINNMSLATSIDTIPIADKGGPNGITDEYRLSTGWQTGANGIISFKPVEAPTR